MGVIGTGMEVEETTYKGKEGGGGNMGIGTGENRYLQRWTDVG
jgi:hypothetical protein